MKTLRAISFDLDDTLWAIWPVIDRAETALHDYICKTFPRIGETHGAGDLRLQRNEIYEQRPDLAHDLTELRRVSFELLLERHGYDPEASHDLIARVLELRHDVTLYPDVVPALVRLSERFPLIALSNGNADISRLGIAQYFQGQISARTAGVKKPDPAIFAMACDLLSAKPSEVLHVGDHPVEDVVGAQQAGLKGAWVNRAEATWPQETAPHLVVEDLTQLADLLDQIE